MPSESILDVVKVRFNILWYSLTSHLSPLNVFVKIKTTGFCCVTKQQHNMLLNNMVYSFLKCSENDKIMHDNLFYKRTAYHAFIFFFLVRQKYQKYWITGKIL